MISNLQFKLIPWTVKCSPYTAKRLVDWAYKCKRVLLTLAEMLEVRVLAEIFLKAPKGTLNFK